MWPEKQKNMLSGNDTIIYFLEKVDDVLIADIYISISTGTFDIENIKYEKKWQQLDLDTNFEP